MKLLLFYFSIFTKFADFAIYFGLLFVRLLIDNFSVKKFLLMNFHFNFYVKCFTLCLLDKSSMYILFMKEILTVMEAVDLSLHKLLKISFIIGLLVRYITLSFIYLY